MFLKFRISRVAKRSLNHLTFPEAPSIETGRFCVLDSGHDSLSIWKLNFALQKKLTWQCHTMLTYNPKGNKLYAQLGKNLTQLVDEPVMTLTQLYAGSLLVLGDST